MVDLSTVSRARNEVNAVQSVSVRCDGLCVWHCPIGYRRGWFRAGYHRLRKWKTFIFREQLFKTNTMSWCAIRVPKRDGYHWLFPIEIVRNTEARCVRHSRCYSDWERSFWSWSIPSASGATRDSNSRSPRDGHSVVDFRFKREHLARNVYPPPKSNLSWVF